MAAITRTMTPPMAAQPNQDVTMLLQAVAAGDSRAAGELLPLVYAELQKLARAYMSREAAGNTLEPTALVHEAYLRLIGDQEVAWDNRGHFFAAAAMAMRRILVERARAKDRLKRGGDRGRVEFTEQSLVVEPPAEEMLSLDEALTRLEQYDQRKSKVVMLRYFAGLNVDETAAALGVSPATVKNEWAYARAWLHRELNADDGEGILGGAAS
jgi:RNA polymerase sigma factor (TIGR02999 family)